MTFPTITFSFPETLTIVVRTLSGVDIDGNDTYTTANTQVPGAFAPGGFSEVQQGGDTVTATPEALLPTGTDVTAIDAVIARGDTYEVTGTPQDWQSPFTGWAPGIVVKLEKVTG